MTSSASSVIELNSVSKKFGERVAVDGLNLQVPSGICFGLLGPNGAGKTTTLRMIYGTTRATSGSIRVFGLDISRNRRVVKSRLGVTLQQNVLIEALSPRVICSFSAVTICSERRSFLTAPRNCLIFSSCVRTPISPCGNFQEDFSGVLPSHCR